MVRLPNGYCRLRHSFPSKLQPQKAMSTSAQLVTLNRNRIASSMTESTPPVLKHARKS
jgi:hypothetical protein